MFAAMARSWVLLFVFGITLTQAASCRRGACNADNCLRAVRASAFPSIHGAADCSKYLATTITAPGGTTTATAVGVVTPTVTETATVTEVSTSVDVVPSTSVVSTFDVTTVTTASYTTITTTTTITTVPAAVAKRKRQPATASPASPASGATPPYASACSGFARYSSACSCIGVTAQTYTTTGAASTVTVSATSTALPNTVVITATQSSATTVTSTSGVVEVTSITATLTSTAYSTTSTSTATATATLYSIALEAQYSSGSTNPGNYFAAASAGSSNGQSVFFFDTQSTTDQQTTYIFDPNTGHLTVSNGAAVGNLVSYGTGGSGSFVVVYNQGTQALTCSLSSDNELDCQYAFGEGASQFGVCDGPPAQLFVYPSGGDTANCQSTFLPVTLYAIAPTS